MTDEQKIIEAIDRIRPYIINDNGNIEFVKYENDIVYIKMLGSCADCEMLDFTLNDTIEMILKEEVPSIKQVININ